MAAFQPPKTRPAMQAHLLGYMLALVLLLLITCIAGFFLFDFFDSAQEDTAAALQIHMNVFEQDVGSHLESLAADSIVLSQYITERLEMDFGITGENFSDLTIIRKPFWRSSPPSWSPWPSCCAVRVAPPASL